MSAVVSISSCSDSSVTVSVTWISVNTAAPLIGCWLNTFFPSQLHAKTFSSSRLQSKTRKRAESWENAAEHLCFFFFFFSQRITTDSYATRLQRLHLSKGGTWDGRQRRWRRKPQRQITVPRCLHFMDNIIKLPRHDGAPVCLYVCVSVFWRWRK